MFRFKAGLEVMRLYRKSHYFFSKGPLGRVIADRIRKKIVIKYSCYISPKSNLHPSIRLPHPVGLVVGEGVIVGQGSTIYQNVTIGAAKEGEGVKGNYPSIGENVTIYAGAVIIGSIQIGSNVIIGANSVVNRNIESGDVVAGVPIRSIK